MYKARLFLTPFQGWASFRVLEYPNKFILAHPSYFPFLSFPFHTSQKKILSFLCMYDDDVATFFYSQSRDREFSKLISWLSRGTSRCCSFEKSRRLNNYFCFSSTLCIYVCILCVWVLIYKKGTIKLASLIIHALLNRDIMKQKYTGRAETPW